MKKIISTTVVGLLAIGSLHAATIFSAANNTNLNDVSNWDNGLPAVANPGTISANGGMTASFSNGDEDLILNASVTTGAFTMSIGGGDQLYIGSGAGAVGSLIVNSGGELEAIGTNEDVYLGSTGGFGTLIFEDGSAIDTRKSMQVFNGLLSFGSDVTTDQNGIQNKFEIGATSTLQFEVNTLFQNHTVQGNTVDMIFQTGATLNLNFALASTTGQTFKLVDDVSTNTGTFTNVTATGLGVGQSLTVTYGTGSDGLVATVVSVPEPSSSALAALGVLFLGVRRR